MLMLTVKLSLTKTSVMVNVQILQTLKQLNLKGCYWHFSHVDPQLVSKGFT